MYDVKQLNVHHHHHANRSDVLDNCMNGVHTCLFILLYIIDKQAFSRLKIFFRLFGKIFQSSECSPQVLYLVCFCNDFYIVQIVHCHKNESKLEEVLNIDDTYLF